MKDEHDYVQQYSELIEVGEEKYLCQSLYSSKSEEAYLIMHQPIDQLLESQDEILQNQEIYQDEIE